MNLIATLTTFAAEQPQGIDALGLDIKAILLQAGTFLILFLVIKKYAFQSIVDNLRDRRETISEGLDNAEKAQKQLDQTKEETTKALKAARAEADTVVTKGHQEADQLVKKAEGTAIKKADGIVNDATKRIQQDADKVRGEIKKEMLGLVTEATETILDEKLDDQKDGQLMERAIKEAA